MAEQKEETHECEQCGAPTTKHCSRCLKSYYCSQKCQRISYRDHKQGCYPVDKNLLENPANKAYIEAFECNIFMAHLILETVSKTQALKPYQKARLQIYSAIVTMVLKDPVEGDSLPTTTTHLPKEWLDLHRKFYADVRSGGEILYRNGGDRAMLDRILWSYVPKIFLPLIDVIWDGIGKWRC